MSENSSAVSREAMVERDGAAQGAHHIDHAAV
jgi:hypothetical protein